MRKAAIAVTPFGLCSSGRAIVRYRELLGTESTAGGRAVGECWRFIIDDGDKQEATVTCRQPLAAAIGLD